MNTTRSLPIANAVPNLACGILQVEDVPLDDDTDVNVGSALPLRDIAFVRQLRRVHHFMVMLPVTQQAQAELLPRTQAHFEDRYALVPYCVSQSTNWRGKLRTPESQSQMFLQVVPVRVQRSSKQIQVGLVVGLGSRRRVHAQMRRSW